MNGPDVLNEEVALEEGIARIHALMHDRHPGDYEINFFAVVKDGSLVELEADDDGWFRVPVFYAAVTAEPVD